MNGGHHATQATRSFAIINIRTPGSSSSNINTLTKHNLMVAAAAPALAPAAGRLTKKSSSTLKADEKAEAASDTMYRYTLRAQHQGKDSRESHGSLAPSIHSTGSGGATDRSASAILSTATAISGTSSLGASFEMGPTASGARDSSIWLHVVDVSEGTLRRIAFPPGVTVGQARDLCMLRFNVWQRIMERDMQAAAQAEASGDGDGASSLVTISTRSSSSASQAQQFGLYWPGGTQWLENALLLSAYALKDGDTVALQDRTQLTAQQGAAATETLAELEEAHGRALGSGAEGYVYYLHTKGINTAWRLCWLVLRAQTLTGHADTHTDGRGRTMVSVDLSRGFRLVDQYGHVNHRVATSDQLQQGSSAHGDSDSVRSDASGISSALGLAALHRQQMGGDGAPLVIRCSAGRVHVFCTQTAVDYDYWRRALRVAQGPSVSQHSSQSGPACPLVPSTMAAAAVPAAAPMVSSLVVQRPRDARTAHVVARPRRERFVANVFRRQSDMPNVGLFCCCVVVSGALHSFSDMALAADTEADALAQAADFTVPLAPDAVMATSEARGGSHIVRLIDCATGNELICLDVGNQEKAAAWADALASIAGISVDALDSQSIRARVPQRTRSFVSTISRIDWPLPPTTIPMSASVSACASISTSTSTSTSAPAPAPAPEPLLDVSEGGAPDGNPSLDAVGLRPLADGDAGDRTDRVDRLPLLPSRFPWFRRPGSSIK